MLTGFAVFLVTGALYFDFLRARQRLRKLRAV